MLDPSGELVNCYLGMLLMQLSWAVSSGLAGGSVALLLSLL